MKILPKSCIVIFRLEVADPEKDFFLLILSEDLDYSDLSDSDEQICIDGEGFIIAILKGFTGRNLRFVRLTVVVLEKALVVLKLS